MSYLTVSIIYDENNFSAKLIENIFQFQIQIFDLKVMSFHN